MIFLYICNQFLNDMRINNHICQTPFASIILPLLLMVGVLSVVSCQSDEERLEAQPYQVLDSILSTTDISFDEALEALFEEASISEEQVAPYRQTMKMAALRARNYKAYTISYHTIDPNGHPVIASGVVYYPKTGTPRGVIEAVSYIKDKNECPSKQLANLQMIQGMAGYIVLVPDLIGFGTTESLPIPYFNHDNVARVSADFRLAATELVRNVYGRKMPSWTLLSGISLAASEAWALARYYHFHPELGVHVNQIWMSGGAYDPLAVLEHQLSTQFTEYAFIPNVVCSVNYYDDLGLNLQNVFKGELSQHYEEWCTGYMPVFDLTDILGTDLGQYLNLDFFKEENPDYQRLKTSIEHFTIPNDWVPSCHVHIYHGRDDTFVPVSCSENLANYLRSVGANVDFVVTETGHIDNIIEMGVDMVEKLYK